MPKDVHHDYGEDYERDMHHEGDIIHEWEDHMDGFVPDEKNEKRLGGMYRFFLRQRNLRLACTRAEAALALGERQVADVRAGRAPWPLDGRVRPGSYVSVMCARAATRTWCCSASGSPRRRRSAARPPAATSPRGWRGSASAAWCAC